MDMRTAQCCNGRKPPTRFITLASSHLRILSSLASPGLVIAIAPR
jgi:hypothetical protein